MVKMKVRAHFQSFGGMLLGHMPVAAPPSPPRSPAPLREGERAFIKEAVKRIYGTDAVVRNFGPNSDRIDLHIETAADKDMRVYDCIGLLLTRIDRRISIELTKRGAKVRGSAKVAYRQGEIL